MVAKNDRNNVGIAGATTKVATLKEAVSKAENSAALERTEREKQEARVAEVRHVRTPTRCHIDLACNTSYHFAASRTVSPRVSSYPFPGTVCAFWLTYMIVSLASI